MYLGLGLYRHMLTPENFRFARQAGATHIVAHWVDYFSGGPRIPQSESRGYGWGVTQNQGRLWTIEELRDSPWPLSKISTLPTGTTCSLTAPASGSNWKM
jgi:hypothetical protein